MIESVTFSLFQRKPEYSIGRGNELPPDLFAECVNKWPHFKKPGKASFTVNAPKDSTTLDEILRLLAAHGFSAHWKKFPPVGYDEPDRFQLEGRREFSPPEISRANYL